MPDSTRFTAASTSHSMPSPPRLLCNSQSAFRRLRRNDPPGRQRCRFFCRCDAWPGRNAALRGAVVDALPSHRNGAPHLLGSLRLMGENAVDHLLLVAEARKLSGGGSPASATPAPPTPATPPAQRIRWHQRVMAPLGVQRQGLIVGSCSTARSCPPSTIAAWVTPGGGAKPGQPRAEGLHSPGGGEQSSRWALASDGSESAGATGEWAD